MTSITLSRPSTPALWSCLKKTGLVLLLAGCAMVKPDKGEKPDVLLWPAPPEVPRFAYEVTLRSGADLVDDTPKRRFENSLTAAVKSFEPAFTKPFSVAARKGKIYVTDTVMRRVAVFDVPRRKIYYMGIHAPGNLYKPSGIALDGEMRVYVSDVTAHKVNVYDNLGMFLYSVGKDGDLDRPTGVAVNAAGDRIYVVDRSTNETKNHRVVVYDNKGNKLFVIGGRGNKPGEFNIPVQAAVAPDGTLYVLDEGNFRIQAFDPNGKFLRTWGKAGNNLGDFFRPRGIAVDDDGNIYATDASFGNVQLFNPKGELLLTLGSRGVKDKPGRYNLPGGVSVDETGRVYVVDQVFNKVDVYRRVPEEEGERLAKISPR